MASSNAPSSEASPPGRRVLVAAVTGAAGATIQAWRAQHDPIQARRLPPHVTLCYWATNLDPDTLGQQVHYAFADPVTVRLGRVHEFDNQEHTFYVEVLDAASLDAARDRLYDGRYCTLPGRGTWTWHITCIRDARRRDVAELRRVAADLDPAGAWRIDTVMLMELRGERYEPVHTWSV